MSPYIHGKSRVLAAIIGLLFGGIGLGIYFGSWKDFFILLVISIILVLMFAAGGVLLSAIISAIWGFWRAS